MLTLGMWDSVWTTMTSVMECLSDTGTLAIACLPYTHIYAPARPGVYSNGKYTVSLCQLCCLGDMYSNGKLTMSLHQPGLRFPVSVFYASDLKPTLSTIDHKEFFRYVNISTG